MGRSEWTSAFCLTDLTLHLAHFVKCGSKKTENIVPGVSVYCNPLERIIVGILSVHHVISLGFGRGIWCTIASCSHERYARCESGHITIELVLRHRNGAPATHCKLVIFRCRVDMLLLGSYLNDNPVSDAGQTVRMRMVLQVPILRCLQRLAGEATHHASSIPKKSTPAPARHSRPHPDPFPIRPSLPRRPPPISHPCRPPGPAAPRC